MRKVSKTPIKTVCNNVDLNEHNGITKSGYLNIGIKKSDSSLSFIFYGAEGIPEQQLKHIPTIIWLNGGPGCSSQFGNFYELGPLYVNKTESGKLYFTQNKSGWTKKYNVIFVDQPIGTGISHLAKNNDIPINQVQLATQFYNALLELYGKNGCFGQLGLNGKDTPLFILGESYAGIGIGDGFTSPYHTISSITDYAFDNGITNSTLYQKAKKIELQGQQAINNSDWVNAVNAFNDILLINNPNNIDQYNIQRKQEPDYTALDDLLNSQYGKSLFKLKLNKKYEQCDNEVYQKFLIDLMQGECIHKVEYLLDQGIHVSVFNGNLDFIVPYYSSEKWVSQLQWKYSDEFNNSFFKEWKGNNNQVYGVLKKYQNLQYFQVFESGHMVSQDQPEAALEMVTKIVEEALKQEVYAQF
ncbi:serine carboxypeptidase family protein, putative [Ichthyophthirius multifiliis]|uniref:Serine carboxypeptidase family protein, putative n=1 Tax=Ichthyophthirius multifiliis TaxID=5932 RepID=G0R0V6_ICHMU|nr:serine carboxypeptidase family protein, putative [Ichthyophthirius multifiliis]EGR28916.1 serine carboxypeptidase family protein, putative [Ichthyophthirius multifiliis]|eukprot:XP_004030152.1 serine carboxypeptidase family protein, putative [Ichthyophthirius multifiliis]